jgi:hypothetical protein
LLASKVLSTKGTEILSRSTSAKGKEKHLQEKQQAKIPRYREPVSNSLILLLCVILPYILHPKVRERDTSSDVARSNLLVVVDN